MSTPTIPARPTRSQQNAPTAVNNMPQIPPRPARKLDPSPNRDVRSPLNEPPNPVNTFMKRPSQSNLSTAEGPARPPSVSLPSIGQEGSEYASYDQLPAEAHGISSNVGVEAPEQTRNIAGDMPLHAPKASVPQSTAKSRIQTVTKTDSTQAAAAGIGSAKPDDDVHKAPLDASPGLPPLTSSRTDGLGRVPSADPLPLRQKPSFSKSSPALPLSSSKPGSINEGLHEYELGIPEIGRQVPLLAMAGDVQAPSPNPTQSQFTQGVGFFNDGSARAHNRKRSGRHEFGPPGSYGMHSHDTEPHTHFERDWYMKNPDKAAMEGFNVYGTPRPETALSSEQLNRMVTQTNDVGMGLYYCLQAQAMVLTIHRHECEHDRNAWRRYRLHCIRGVRGANDVSTPLPASCYGDSHEATVKRLATSRGVATAQSQLPVQCA